MCGVCVYIELSELNIGVDTVSTVRVEVEVWKEFVDIFTCAFNYAYKVGSISKFSHFDWFLNVKASDWLSQRPTSLHGGSNFIG